MRSDDQNVEGRKVGALARATGLTVRTLHHYEQIGLLVASARSDGGHRLYSASDVERLYRICLLRRLGLTLAEVADALDDPGWNLRASVARHLDDLDWRMAAAAQLRGQLTKIAASVDGKQTRPPRKCLRARSWATRAGRTGAGRARRDPCRR